MSIDVSRFSLEGKVALIVGGSGDLGHAIVNRFAQAGATILLAASVFHFGMIKIPDLKEYLRGRGVGVSS